MQKVLKIVITDDHEVLIDGLIALLAPEADLQVVGKALNGRDLLELLAHKPVDLVIMDIDMPEMDGVVATQKLKEQFPHIKVLVLTMYSKPDFIKNLMRSGVDGYMLKYSSKRDLVRAIRSVAENEFFYTPEIAQEVMQSLRSDSTTTEETPVLSEREKEIIRLVAQEYTSREIAEQLYLSYHTVERHRKNILAKLGVKNVAGLVRYALKNGLVD
ncbi:MAG: response regulator transcription factor [Bacteroidota bacterium]